MNGSKNKGLMFLVTSIVCLISGLILLIVFTIHCVEYYGISDVVAKLAYGFTLILEILFTALVLSVGTVFSWLSYKFSDTGKFKKASKITAVICLAVFGVSILALAYSLCI
ncbi:MAG: hypothetical protein E7633_04755 [Ruminococcaceae bacterium]|nr:hypothetical protein [Oscillospiraceae bacterium]